MDFLKTDTDGSDFAVLAGGSNTLQNTLGVLAEVTLAPEKGGALLRDVDALLSEQGFYLAHLAPQTYTRAALPGHFVEARLMAQTHQGAVNWADALFLRDVPRAGPGDIQTALRYALLCELFNLPDVAAEALLAVREQAPREIGILLDGLVPYSGLPSAETYDAMIAAFEADPRQFA